MVDIRRHNLSGLGESFSPPAIVPLTGLRPFVGHPAVAVFRAQDEIAAQSRRTLLSWGLRGDAEWRIPNTDTTTPAFGARTHPDRSTWYVVARERVEVTPGCFLSIHVACLPSGETQRAALNGSGQPIFVADGVHGAIRITVLWRDRAGGTETSQHVLDLPGSTLEFGAEDTTAGGFWRNLREREIPLIAPPGVPDDVTELARFSRLVTAEIVVEHQGSPRVVDATIEEVPVAIALDLDESDDDAYAVSHIFAPGHPNAPVAPARFCFERWTERALVTARAQAQCLGPLLLTWTAYTETDATPTASVVPRTTANDGTTFESILNSSHTGTGSAAYNSALPGWSVSCGGYARRWVMCNHLALRDRVAVVPVLVRVYGRAITAGTATVRVQTALHSYVDVPIPVGSATWHTAIGYLEVGITPEQPKIAQVFLNHVGASGSLEVHAVNVYYSSLTPIV
jgi:hypothetical protein